MRLLLSLLLALAVPAGAAAQDRPRAVVLRSADRTAYAAVVAGFSAEVRAEVEDIALDESPEQAGRTLARIQAMKPTMVLAIGPAAAVAARKALPGIPIVFCMVPYFEKYMLEGANVTGIALTGDLTAELETLKAVAPSRKRVGILHDPRYSGTVVEAAQAHARALGMTVVPLEVDGESRVPRVLAGAREKIDAMMMVGDKTVATAAVVKRLIAFCDEEKLPLLALTASQVKEGAMVSLSASPVGIGQQAGRLGNRIIHEKVDAGALAVAQPEVLDLSINLTTAKRLGATCDLLLEIFKLAAAKAYPLKVFE